MTEYIKTLDSKIFKAISSLPHPYIFRLLALIIHLLTWGGIIYYPFITYLALHKPTYHIAELWFSSLAVTYIVTDIILKTLIKRPRPYEGNPDVEPLPFPPTSHSFPSGQSAAAAASAMILGLFFSTPQMITFFVIGALLVCFDRMYTRHHYPSDVIGGVIVGSAISALIYFLL